MAVQIRLARHGSKKSPFYRLIVADKRAKRDGRFIEKLGTFLPANEGKLDANWERIAYWKSQGAQVSDTVGSLFRKHAPKA